MTWPVSDLIVPVPSPTVFRAKGGGKHVISYANKSRVGSYESF